MRHIQTRVLILAAVSVFFLSANRFPLIAQDSSTPTGNALKVSEETLINAHKFLDGCAQALDAVPGVGSIAKGGAKGVLNVALPSDESVMRKQMSLNHAELLRQLGSVNSQLESIGVAMNEVKRSVEADAEEQLYVKCRTLYSDLIDNQKSAADLRSATEQLENMVYDARHMLEVRPRGIVFHLLTCNASLCVSKLRELSSAHEDLNDVSLKLQVISGRIESILESCEQKGTYSEESRLQLVKQFEDCREKSYQLLKVAGLAPCSECNADTVNSFCFQGREQDGEPDVEITLFPYSRVEKYNFRNVTYSLQVSGPVVVLQSGYERFRPITLAGFRQGAAENPVVTINVVSDDESSKTPMFDRVKPAVDAYNQSIIATNETCAALLIAESARKLIDMNKKVLGKELVTK